MPKQALTINDFSGGLNTDISPRDLEPNELSTCQNADPSSKGRRLNTMVFSDDDTNFADTGSTASGSVGTGLFAFSNDKDISGSHADLSGDLIVKADSANAELDVQETSDKALTTDITGSSISGTDIAAPASPQFYTAEGDLYIGGDHTTSPYALKYHSQKKFDSAAVAGRNVTDWVGSTQTRTIPTTSTMDVEEADNSGSAVTGLVTNKLNWIVKYGADNTGLWSNEYAATLGSGLYNEFGGSWLYKNKAESDIVLIGTNTTDGSLNTEMTGTANHTDANLTVQAWVLGAPTSAGDHVYGARLYSRKNLESTWYLLAEISYEKGIRGDGETGWEPWEDATASDPDFDHAANADSAGDDTDNAYQATTGPINAPPLLVTFETNNGYSTADIVDTVYWKHGVVANSRAYIGNVLLNSKPYGDRILKSPVFQYDVFAETSYIDVASNDGDEITALATYGDMLLEFKERKLYLINISKELEYMEDVKENAGVKTPAAVCKTPFGVAWVNYNGAYLYNGSEVTQLTMGKISDSDWNTNIGGTAVNNICGYDPINRQLIVLWDGSSGGSNRGKAYVFTFDTNSWHYVSDMIGHADNSVPDQNCTNMVNTSDGKLLIGGGTDVDEILVYGARSGRTTTTSQVDIRTGQLSLGNPAIKKNLANVKVRYKYGGGDLTVSIITNDDSDDTGVATNALTVNTDSGGDTDYLSDTSGNVHTREYNTLGIAAFQNQYWFQVKIAGTADYRFELDEVVLTYRELGVR